jgi:hypothetical protein
MTTAANCRSSCGACCIAPSISPCPALPRGKAAGERCRHLTIDVRCALFGRSERPTICVWLRPQLEVCAESVEEAMATLVESERLTRPDES